MPRTAERAPVAAARPASAAERARRRLVAIVVAIYLLAIFEGSLRKYVLPEFGQFIFFVRDPLVAWAYLLATRWRLWPRASVPLRIAAAAAVLGVVLLVAQFAFGSPSDLRLLLGLYGWRAYFFYVPLAFLVGEQLRADDLRRLAKLTLLLAVPIAALVALQFFSPPGAAINVGTSDDAALQFHDLTLDTAHIRPSGPFSSNAGQQQFVATAFALLLAFLLMPAARRRTSGATLAACAAGIVTCIALSGSRGTTLQCGMILLFSLPIALLGRGAALKARALVLPGALALAAVVLAPLVFPEAVAAFLQRWDVAAHDESAFEGGVLGRALYGFVDFMRFVDFVPPLGFGLGYGGNASRLLGASVDGVLPGELVETDYARHMVDLGPAVGFAYIALRFALVAWLARRTWQATRRSSDPLPMMLFAYAGYVVLIGQVTGNGSINVYGWLFAGLCIAACRSAMPAATTRTVAGR